MGGGLVKRDVKAANGIFKTPATRVKLLQAAPYLQQLLSVKPWSSRTRSAPPAARSPGFEPRARNKGTHGAPVGWSRERRRVTVERQGVKKGPQGTVEPRGNESPRARASGIPLWPSTHPLPSGSLSISGGSGWARQKGCGRQDPAQPGSRLEHPLRALRSNPRSRRSPV